MRIQPDGSVTVMEEAKEIPKQKLVRSAEESWE